MPGIRFVTDLCRGRTLRPSINDWLMFKNLERDWLMKLLTNQDITLIKLIIKK